MNKTGNKSYDKISKDGELLCLRVCARACGFSHGCITRE